MLWGNKQPLKDMKNKILIKKLKLPIYGTSFWIIISRSIIKAIDHIEDTVNDVIIRPEYKGSTRAYMYAYQESSGKHVVMVFLNPNSTPGEIAHEVNHALNNVFLWNGVRITTSNDEHQSYYLEYLIDKVHSTINKYKKILNK